MRLTLRTGTSHVCVGQRGHGVPCPYEEKAAHSFDHQVEEFVGDVDLFHDALAVDVTGYGRIG